MYGPLASALSFIVHCGNKKQTDLPKVITVYRGLKMPVSELDSKYIEGHSINLQGYTSTTLNFGVAVKFAIKGVLGQAEDSEYWPVLVEIKVKGSQ